MTRARIEQHLRTVRYQLRGASSPVARGRLRALERRLMAKLVDSGIYHSSPHTVGRL